MSTSALLNITSPNTHTPDIQIESCYDGYPHGMAQVFYKASNEEGAAAMQFIKASTYTAILTPTDQEGFDYVYDLHGTSFSNMTVKIQKRKFCEDSGPYYVTIFQDTIEKLFEMHQTTIKDYEPLVHLPSPAGGIDIVLTYEEAGHRLANCKEILAIWALSEHIVHGGMNWKNKIKEAHNLQQAMSVAKVNQQAQLKTLQA